jgi:hypothetical protein
LALGTTAFLLGCSDPNGSSGDDGDDTNKGGGSGTGTGGTGNGGGSGGSGGVMCSNPAGAALPIDASGWVARECNDHGIQGAFYCYDDMINPTSCPPAAADGTRPPPFLDGRGMCISGNTTVDPTYAAWGAGLGLTLNDPQATPPRKDPYNATANGVTGFHLDIAGNTGGLPLRVGYSITAVAEGAQPFVQFPAGVTSLDVAIQDAIVPSDWMDVNAGAQPDPAAIFDLQVQIPGGEVATPYDFCITNVTPIGSGGPVGGTVPPYGTQQCQPLGTIDLPARYMVQNNVYNAQGGTQCITAGWDMGANAGFVASPMLSVPAGSAPASYPSIVLGWHYGRWYGSYTAARQLQTLQSIISNWTFTVPPSGRYNASYDAWIHPTNANPPNPMGGVELMIWVNERDTTPIGSVVGTTMIGGASWEIWYGPNQGGWTTVSYIRAGNVSSVANLDLLPFFVDAAQRNYTTGASYLLSIQAGFEIWEQNQPMTTNSYSVAIN